MRWVLIACILGYRCLPVRFRRTCIFRETCSLFVLRAAREGGAVAAWRSFRLRWRQCRPVRGVECNAEGGDLIVVLADGSRVGAEALSHAALRAYGAVLSRLDAQGASSA